MSAAQIRSHILDLSDYNIIKEIKKGGFGIVYLIENKTTGKRLAAKVNIQNNDSTGEQDKLISREVGILLRVQAPTIIKFFGFSLKDFQNYSHVTILMEYKENGSLQQLIDKERLSQSPHDYDNTAKQIILCGIAHGMNVLHSRRVIHRDLKPDNILLDSNYRPCITDFDLSKFLDPDNTKSQSMFGCGTTPYIAPEIFNGNHYGPKADVYSFGILMYEVITGEKAYADILKKKNATVITFANKVIGGERPKFNIPIKESMRKLIEQCWSQEPRDRPTFKEIFNKLSLSLEDDETVVEGIKKIISKDQQSEEEGFDYYRYCLDDVDVERVFDYVEEITSSGSTSNESLQEKVEELTKRVVELEKQNQQKDNEIRNQQIAISDLKKPISNTPINFIPNVYSIPKLNRGYTQGICGFLLAGSLDHGNTKTIKITGFPDANGDQSTLDKIVSDENASAWCSKNDPNAYIQFDFGQSSVSINTFQLWTGDDSVNGRHLKSVKLSASNDAQNWTQIDSWSCSLNGPNEIRYYPSFYQDEANFARYLKLQANGPNYKGTNELYLKRIEFFGLVQPKTQFIKPTIDIANTFSIPKLLADDENGICQFLIYNISDFSNEKTIKITAYPDANNDQQTLNQIVVNSNEKAWCSQNVPNPYIVFDFGKNSISFTAMRITTGDDPVNGRHLKSYIIYGSNDSNEWKRLASFNCSNLNGPDKKNNMILNNRNTNFYHYIKLQFKENYKGTNELYLKRVEFFGNVERSAK